MRATHGARSTKQWPSRAPTESAALCSTTQRSSWLCPRARRTRRDASAAAAAAALRRLLRELLARAVRKREALVPRRPAPVRLHDRRRLARARVAQRDVRVRARALALALRRDEPARADDRHREQVRRAARAPPPVSPPFDSPAPPASRSASRVVVPYGLGRARRGCWSVICGASEVGRAATFERSKRHDPKDL